MASCQDEKGTTTATRCNQVHTAEVIKALERAGFEDDCVRVQHYGSKMSVRNALDTFGGIISSASSRESGPWKNNFFDIGFTIGDPSKIYLFGPPNPHAFSEGFLVQFFKWFPRFQGPFSDFAGTTFTMTPPNPVEKNEYLVFYGNQVHAFRNSYKGYDQAPKKSVKAVLTVIKNLEKVLENWKTHNIGGLRLEVRVSANTLEDAVEKAHFQANPDYWLRHLSSETLDGIKVIEVADYLEYVEFMLDKFKHLSAWTGHKNRKIEKKQNQYLRDMFNVFGISTTESEWNGFPSLSSPIRHDTWYNQEALEGLEDVVEIEEPVVGQALLDVILASVKFGKARNHAEDSLACTFFKVSARNGGGGKSKAFPSKEAAAAEIVYLYGDDWKERVILLK